MEKELLAVKGLSVSVEDKPILDHVNLEIGMKPMCSWGRMERVNPRWATR